MERLLQVNLIPAHAGVILMPIFSTIEPISYPRARGGDPRLSSAMQYDDILSPRTRG